MPPLYLGLLGTDIAHGISHRSCMTCLVILNHFRAVLENRTLLRHRSLFGDNGTGGRKKGQFKTGRMVTLIY